MLHFKSFTGYFQIISELLVLEIKHLIEVLSRLGDALLCCLYRLVFDVQLLLETVDDYLEMRILPSYPYYLHL